MTPKEGTPVACSASCGDRHLSSRNSRRKASPIPSAPPNSNANNPLRRGLGLIGVPGDVARSQTVTVRVSGSGSTRRSSR